MAWVRDVTNAQNALDTVTKQTQALPNSKAFSAFPDNEVLRVFQFDAITAQQEIMDILQHCLYDVFNIVPLQSFCFAYQEELVLLLDLLIYRYSVWRRGQSVGDRLQNLVMRDEQVAAELQLQSSTVLIPSLAPSHRLLLIHATCSILVPYVVHKVQRKALNEAWEHEEPSSWKRRAATGLRYTFIAWSSLSLLNTLHFFATGRYRTLLERLLSLKVVYGSQKMQRFSNLIYLNQHLWWQTWSSLLSVLHVGRYLSRLMHSVQSITSPSKPLINENVCSVCREPPTISQRSNCGHLYCYYCIKSRLLDTHSSGSFRCFQCGLAVHECFPA